LRSEEGLVLLGDSCFKGCTALKKVQVPSSVGHLDDRCFEDFEGCTSLSKVDWLGGGPVQIDKGCFRGCALATVVVPRGVGELDTGAFEVCASLRSVVWVGDGPTTVSAGVFKDCKALPEVSVRVGWECCQTPRSRSAKGSKWLSGRRE
jgi:hypothetical protein